MFPLQLRSCRQKRNHCGAIFPAKKSSRFYQVRRRYLKTEFHAAPRENHAGDAGLTTRERLVGSGPCGARRDLHFDLRWSVIMTCVGFSFSEQILWLHETPPFDTNLTETARLFTSSFPVFYCGICSTAAIVTCTDLHQMLFMTEQVPSPRVARSASRAEDIRSAQRPARVPSLAAILIPDYCESRKCVVNGGEVCVGSFCFH